MGVSLPRRIDFQQSHLCRYSTGPRRRRAVGVGRSPGTTEDFVEGVVHRALLSGRPLKRNGSGDPAVSSKGGEDRQGFGSRGDLLTRRRLAEEGADEAWTAGAGRSSFRRWSSESVRVTLTAFSRPMG